jgi:hypothetical protein
MNSAGSSLASSSSGPQSDTSVECPPGRPRELPDLIGTLADEGVQAFELEMPHLFGGPGIELLDEGRN